MRTIGILTNLDIASAVPFAVAACLKRLKKLHSKETNFF